jgi:hypothetical protein
MKYTLETPGRYPGGTETEQVYGHGTDDVYRGFATVTVTSATVASLRCRCQ